MNLKSSDVVQNCSPNVNLMNCSSNRRIDECDTLGQLVCNETVKYGQIFVNHCSSSNDKDKFWWNQ